MSKTEKTAMRFSFEGSKAINAVEELIAALSGLEEPIHTVLDFPGFFSKFLCVKSYLDPADACHVTVACEPTDGFSVYKR